MSSYYTAIVLFLCIILLANAEATVSPNVLTVSMKTASSNQRCCYNEVTLSEKVDAAIPVEAYIPLSCFTATD